MSRWIRVTIPLEYAFVALGIYLFLTLGLWTLGAVIDGPGRLELFNPVGGKFLVFAAGAFGFYRGAFFHPGLRPEYRKWLEGTPWHVGLPLPLGPVTLAIQDLVAVSLLTGMAALHPAVVASHVPVVFVTVYLITTLGSLVVTQYFGHLFLLLFGLGGLLYVGAVPRQWATTVHVASIGGVLTMLYLLVRHGLLDGLRRFREWDLPSLKERVSTWVALGTAETRQRLLGWPFDRLAPRGEPKPIPPHWSLAVATLVTWWVFVVCSAVLAESPAAPLRNAYAAAAVIVLQIGAGRTGAYMWGHLPPISLWGRLMTFRWIIPGYDVVFVPWIGGMVLAAVVPFVLEQLVFPPLYGVPLLVGLETLWLLAAPPGLVAWRLTAPHRIVPGAILQTNELQQTA